MSNQPVINSLKKVLIDNYALYLKTQNYHWNVEGENFSSLHLLFEGQYTDLAAAVDTIAELIRGLGEKVPAITEIYKTSVIKPAGDNLSATKMVKELANDQELIQTSLQKSLEIAQKAGDEVVADFLIQRLTTHRKAAWFLRSSL